jgi:hypothetical protein
MDTDPAPDWQALDEDPDLIPDPQHWLNEPQDTKESLMLAPAWTRPPC